MPSREISDLVLAAMVVTVCGSGDAGQWVRVGEVCWSKRADRLANPTA